MVDHPASIRPSVCPQKFSRYRISFETSGRIFFKTSLGRSPSSLGTSPGPKTNGPRHEKTCPRDLRPGKTHTSKLSYRD